MPEVNHADRFVKAVREALSRRLTVEYPASGGQSEMVRLPVPEGATFTDGTLITRVFCMSLSCEWFTARRRASRVARWNGVPTPGAAYRPYGVLVHGEPASWIVVILRQDPAKAEAQYRELLKAVQSRDGAYYPDGLGEFTGPCRAWGLPVDVPLEGFTVEPVRNE